MAFALRGVSSRYGTGGGGGKGDLPIYGRHIHIVLTARTATTTTITTVVREEGQKEMPAIMADTDRQTVGELGRWAKSQ